MGTVGTFDGFTAARLGIYAAYKGLSLTGNNISNINTEGYTRQVIDQVSLKTGANDTYRSQYDNHIGQGALVTGINQIRDPYLDIRFRNTNADVGYYDETLNGLQQLAAILDEVGKGEGDREGDGMLYAQLQDLADSLRAISADPCKDNDTLARTSADALVGLFNKYAEKLENLRLDYVDSLNQDVKTVNGILTNIRNLNESIRESDIHGDHALEMRDERNRQIDELSQYMHIKVTYTMEEIGGGVEVERCTISLANDNPDPKVTSDSSILVDGIYGSQIDIPEKLPIENPKYSLAAAGRNQDKMAAPGFDINNPDDLATLEPEGFRYLSKNVDLKTFDPDNFTPTTANVTDKIDEAATVNNTGKDANYIVTISRLYDSRGEEWTKPTTTWEKADGNVGASAKYTYTISESKNWTAGDELKLLDGDGNPIKDGDGNEVVIRVKGTIPSENEGEAPTPVDGDISAAAANDPVRLAKAIAEKLDGTEAYKGYYVRSNGSTVIFTAKNKGEIKAENAGKDGAAPSAAPALKFGTFDADSGSVSFVDADPKEVRHGEDVVEPTDPDYPGGTTWNENGSETEITFIKGEKGWMKCTVTTEYTYEVTLDDNDLHGSLQATRELLTENGEFATNKTVAKVDENAKSKRGIPYYQKSFDLLARQFAEQYNKLNQGFMVDQDGYYIDEDGNRMELASVPGVPLSKTEPLTEEQADALKAAGCVDKDGNADVTVWLQRLVDNPNAAVRPKVPDGVGVLFSNRGDTDDTRDITAANISISASWSGGSVKIVPTMVELFGKDPHYKYDQNGNVMLDDDGKPLPNTTQNENVNHMITLVNESLLYDPRSMVDDAAGTKLFQGSFNDMFSNMNIVLGNDQRKTNTKLNSQYTSLIEIDTSREGVSGVDLNDEAMNMMQYQKAYSAACRIMTAIDEVLERLINNTGVAGR